MSKSQGLDWEAVRAQYRERRIAEGATPLELKAEQVPPNLVITPKQFRQRYVRILEEGGAKLEETMIGGSTVKEEIVRRNQEIQNAYYRGATVWNLSADYGLGTQQIRNILKNGGVYQPNRDKHKPTSRRGENLQNHGPSNDYSEFVRLHTEEGLSISQIARELGVHRTTVSAGLIASGVEPKRRKSISQRDQCKRGHDLSQFGKPVKGGRGGRYCGECKRLRQNAKNNGEEFL